MRNVQNCLIEGCRLSYSGWRAQVNEDILSSIRREASRYFRNKKGIFERQDY
jgi:hypothetical protein